MKTNYLKYKSVLWILIIACLFSCNKLVEVEAPITSTNANTVFNENTSAASVVTGIYADMIKATFSSTQINAVPLYTGLSSDEFNLFGQTATTYFTYYTNNVLPQTVASGHFWSTIYPLIYRVNVAIEELNRSVLLNPDVKKHLLGECKFLRAYCYFYLVNFYGDIPLVLTSDYKINSTVSRSDKNLIYQQIVTDLIAAESLLTINYLSADVLSSTLERVRPNKYAATALLARVYLYMKDYKNAEIKSSVVIDQSSLYSLVPLGQVFLKDSKEALWQLAIVGNGVSSNSPEGRIFALPTAGPGPSFPVYLNPNFATKFDVNDLRLTNWISQRSINGVTYLYPSKYKIGLVSLPTSEYSMKLRLAEQYLIRAESRINLNDIENGIADLNEIRKRATNMSVPTGDQLSKISVSLSKDAALLAVETERVLELFTEGHRWFDLKRTNRADVVLSPLKGATWQTSDQLYPIPQSEMTLNPALTGKQNIGY